LSYLGKSRSRSAERRPERRTSRDRQDSTKRRSSRDRERDRGRRTGNFRAENDLHNNNGNGPHDTFGTNDTY
jgi:hypothetical protein